MLPVLLELFAILTLAAVGFTPRLLALPFYTKW